MTVRNPINEKTTPPAASALKIPERPSGANEWLVKFSTLNPVKMSTTAVMTGTAIFHQVMVVFEWAIHFTPSRLMTSSEKRIPAATTVPSEGQGAVRRPRSG